MPLCTSHINAYKQLKDLFHVERHQSQGTPTERLYAQNLCSKRHTFCMEIYGLPKHNSNSNDNNTLLLSLQLRNQVLMQYFTKICAVPRTKAFAIVNMIIVLITPITLIKLFCFLLSFVLCFYRTILYTLYYVFQLILSAAITLFGQHLAQNRHYIHKLPIPHQQ